MSIVQEQTKKCSKCGQLKPVSAFSKNSRKSSGLRSECKMCQSVIYAKWAKRNPGYKKEWYRANSEKVIARSKRHREEFPEEERKRHTKYRKDHPESKRASEQRRRAKKAKVANDDHTDSQVWELYGTDCYLCGVQVVKDGERVKGLYHEEHVIPIDLGGDNTLDNVRPSCQPCNSSKYVSPLLKFLAQRQPDDLVVTEADSSEYAEECRRLDSGMICVGHSVKLSPGKT